MPSGWEKASTIATIVQAVVVIASLYYIHSQLELQNSQLQLQTSQLQLQTDLTKAANAQTLVGMSMPANLLTAENREIARIWLKGATGVAPKPSEIEALQYDALVSTYLTFHENIYMQYQKKLLDEDIYLAWDKDLENFVRGQRLEKHWDEITKMAYHQNFRDHVDELIKRRPLKKTP